MKKPRYTDSQDLIHLANDTNQGYLCLIYAMNMV